MSGYLIDTNVVSELTKGIAGLRCHRFSIRTRQSVAGVGRAA